MTIMTTTEQQLLDLQTRVEALELAALSAKIPTNNRTYYEQKIITDARQYATLKAFGTFIECDGNLREYISQPAKSDVPGLLSYYRATYND